MKKPISFPLSRPFLRILAVTLLIPGACPFSLSGAEPDDSSSAPAPLPASEKNDPAASITRSMEIDRALRSGDLSKVIAMTKDLEKGDPLIRYRAFALQRRGEQLFQEGLIDESIADFDAFLTLQPDQDPYHWQRGISYYYAGEFEKGKAQFERHQTVNPQDVENAVFHFICSVRAPGGSLEKARQAFIKIDEDARVPMKEIHAFYAGEITGDKVIAAAGSGKVNEAEKANRLFYTHLYLGLFYDATGDRDKAARHIALAAGKYPQDHYMGKVAEVHAKLRQIPIEPEVE